MNAKVICLFAVIAFAVADENCSDGYWGTNCVNYCGYCASEVVDAGAYNRRCNSVDGSCSKTYGCQPGYMGSRCDEPICSDCSNGVCVAPDVCQLCKDISHVSPNCVNIKLRGLLGSLIAIIVLTSSLIGCGLGSMMYQRRKNASVAL